MTKHLTSALPALKPTQIVDTKTGEINPTTFGVDLDSLVGFVRDVTEEYFSNNEEGLLERLEGYRGFPQAAEFARQQGICLPGETKMLARSRVERLFRHKLITETASYQNNPNPYKQRPTFSKKINLGAVDSQMVRLRVSECGEFLFLLFKCWSREYELEFKLPYYLQKRNIVKYSLPTIQWSKRQSAYVFIFTIQEQPKPRKTGKHHAGTDLGRTQPYTLTITNQHGNRVADYVASGRIAGLNKKRERLLKERKHILVKADHYDALGIDSTLLRKEAQYKRNKITLLGKVVGLEVAADLTKKLVKHDVSILALEDLSWVTGAKYGSKWVHSKTQTAITHSLKREGITTHKVNPKNTSQHCHKCGIKLIHNNKKRTVHCQECSHTLDRDYNAAMNITNKLRAQHALTLNTIAPPNKRKNGDNSSPQKQVIASQHNSVLGMKT